MKRFFKIFLPILGVLIGIIIILMPGLWQYQLELYMNSNILKPNNWEISIENIQGHEDFTDCKYRVVETIRRDKGVTFDVQKSYKDMTECPQITHWKTFVYNCKSKEKGFEYARKDKDAQIIETKYHMLK